MGICENLIVCLRKLLIIIPIRYCFSFLGMGIVDSWKFVKNWMFVWQKSFELFQLVQLVNLNILFYFLGMGIVNSWEFVKILIVCLTKFLRIISISSTGKVKYIYIYISFLGMGIVNSWEFMKIWLFVWQNSWELLQLAQLVNLNILFPILGMGIVNSWEYMKILLFIWQNSWELCGL